MEFIVIPTGEPVPETSKDKIYLRHDDWDDLGKFQTLYQLYAPNAQGDIVSVGGVKIGEVGLLPLSRLPPSTKGKRSPSLEPAFPRLESHYFSLGQRQSYYETLQELPAEVRDTILDGLNDIARDLAKFEAHGDELVMQLSLMRFVESSQVREQFHPLARGDTLTNRPFRMAFHMNQGDGGRLELTFDVTPSSVPPSNIHALIGSNGVGKTTLLKDLVNRAATRQAEDSRFAVITENDEQWGMSGVIWISFSAFDTFDLSSREKDGAKREFIGLRHYDPEANNHRPRTTEELATDFIQAMRACRDGARAQRLRHALKILSVEPLFARTDPETMLDAPAEERDESARLYFDNLSSGHKIVVLTIARLIELVDDRTLVVMDEPEGHLHPPLLSAFIRCTSDLLTERNGIAILATHSPVVLQEVPSNCVWLLDRTPQGLQAERPQMQTYGESIDALTRQAFRLQLSRTGYHQLLCEAVDKASNLQEVIDSFGGQLGIEAQAVARGLLMSKRLKEIEGASE